MIQTDRIFKGLLLVLIGLVSGLIVRSIGSPVPGSPNGGATATGAQNRVVAGRKSDSSSTVSRAYAVVVSTTDGSSVVIGGKGNPFLSADGVRLALQEAMEEGWNVHSVIPVVSGEVHPATQGSFGKTETSFLVIVQK